MNSMQRVLTAMAHREPDRVPLFLFTTMHGAKEVGLSIRDYFSSAEHMVEGQMRLLAKYGSDCLNPLGNTVVEAEAFGAETVYIDNGPPNVGAPVISRPEAIDRLDPPRITESPSLVRALDTIRGLKDRVGDTVPIVGVVIAPFSLPIVQMGFQHYLDLLFEQPARFARLMAVNQAFCVEWANAQLKAGATAIGYADPMSATANIPRALYLETGHRIARETLVQIDGPTAIHFASARALGIAGDLAATGAAAVAVSAQEDLSDWKGAVGDRLTIIGNLNGVAMRRWTAEEAEAQVRRAIAKAGAGGGFVLSDNHGEIPWQVPEDTLLTIRDAVERWGRYPLELGN